MVLLVLGVVALPATLVGLAQRPPSQDGGGGGRTVPAGVRLDGIAADLARRFVNEPGFDTVFTDPSSTTVTVRWHGRVPAALAALDGRLREGVRVQVLRSAYSADELLRASDDLASRARSEGIELVSLGPDGAFGGLVVSLPDAESIARDGPRLRELAGAVPLRVSGATAAESLNRRSSDAPPD